MQSIYLALLAILYAGIGGHELPPALAGGSGHPS
jgi:hypothetical protein